MDVDLLIDEITKNVVSRLKDEMCIRAFDESKSENRILVLLPENVLSIGKFLNYVKGKYEDGELLVAGNVETLDGVLKPELSNSITCVNIQDKHIRHKVGSIFDSYKEVCCIAPGIKLLENIAKGDDSQFIEYLLLQGILHKKPTTIYVDYMPNGISSDGLMGKVSTLFREIEASGIKVENIDRQTDAVISAEKVYQDGLITEQDIDEMWANGVTEVDCSRCIVTPLAKDRAKELSITLKY
ncbi:MAG TPA: hypothetical protein GXZ32_02760 [Clostridiales bacterium]|nr:hypothetical protein [Clostridiales bacterium]